MNIPVTPDAKFADLVDEWLRRLRAEGRLEGTTINEYERVSNSQDLWMGVSRDLLIAS